LIKESGLIGLVPAAGAGRRLRPYTDTLPKALVPVDGDTTVLDITLGNFAAVGLTDVVVIIGYCADAVRERQADLEKRHGVNLELVFNDKAETWNNAYSLWCAREHFSRGFVLANGDTVHPVSVEQTLLGAKADLEAAGGKIMLAVDDVKSLADEEMKVQLSADRALTRITKLMEPSSAAGEYIGVTLALPAVADELADALETTFTRDPDLYYEDGYQELVNRGVRIDVAPIGDVPWVEVDNHDDLARAREIACRY
jgi:choline kinase